MPIDQWRGYKARLVAQGYTQTFVFDYDENLNTVRSKSTTF